MPLWKISAKNNWNWGTGKQLVKGMFIEMSTQTTTPPLGQTKNQEAIARDPHLARQRIKKLLHGLLTPSILPVLISPR